MRSSKTRAVYYQITKALFPERYENVKRTDWNGEGDSYIPLEIRWWGTMTIYGITCNMS